MLVKRNTDLANVLVNVTRDSCFSINNYMNNNNNNSNNDNSSTSDGNSNSNNSNSSSKSYSGTGASKTAHKQFRCPWPNQTQT